MTPIADLASSLSVLYATRYGESALAGVSDLRLFRLQSAQVLFVSSFSRFLIVCWFWAA